MKRILFILLLSAFFSMTACTTTEKPSDALVSEAVQGTLTAMTASAETISANPEKTTPVEPQNTPTRRVIISSPPASSPTPKTSPTAKAAEVLADDLFSQNAGAFGIPNSFEDETIRMNLADGILTIEPKMMNGWRNWRLRPPEFSDGTVEAEFRFNTCKGSDQFGLVIRAANYADGNGYYCSISCNEEVQIRRDLDIIASARLPENLLKNDSMNRLTVSASEDLIEVFVNETKITEVRDAAYQQGFSGFFTAPTYQDTLSVALDRYKIIGGRYQPPQKIN